MKMLLIKTMSGFFPADSTSEEKFNKIKRGVAVTAEIKSIRNYLFLKKFFKRFRKDVTILAGYHHTVIRLDGTARVEADSISFAKMEQETFEGLYSNVLDVLLNRIPMLKKMGAEDVSRAVDKLLEFA